MRTAWSGRLSDRFTVREMQQTMPELAYTTVMTTVSRLASKELLKVEPDGTTKAFVYVIGMTPLEFIAASSRHDAEKFVKRYGDTGLAAFAARFDRLSPARRERLRRLGGR